VQLNLKGKVVLVTGAAKGIGRMTALRLAEEGAKVVVDDILDDVGQAVVDEIKAKGGTAAYVHGDVRLEEDIKGIVKFAVATYGRLDGAVNNAGIGLPGTKVEDAELAQVADLLQVDLIGVFACMKYEIPELLKQGGSIVNLTSIAGLKADATGLASYIMAKHGVVGLTKAAALENATRGVRVNAIAPGVIETEAVTSLKESHPDAYAIYSKNNPVGRFGDTVEIADTAVFLLSDAASLITGAVISVDGGAAAG
jgi:NAD(P)-dependent dehydrogenase (short-subunit alcohol dehydrogenase family)